MPPQNPFSAFSVEDQSDIQDQLAAAYNSGHMNPAQRISVGNALRNLAQSRTPLSAPPGLQGPPPSTNQYKATPDSSQENAQTRLGQLIPEGAIDPLETAKKYAVDPFDRAASAGAEAANTILAGPTSLPIVDRAGDGIIPGHPLSPVEHGIKTAIGNVVGGTVADPRQWPLLFTGGEAVRPLIGKLMSSGFAAQMSVGTLHDVADLNNNWDKYSPDQRAEKITSAGLSGVFATLSAAHAALPHPVTTPSEAPSSVTPAEVPQSVTTPESPKQSIEPEYVNDTVSPASGTPAVPADASPSAAAPDLARQTTPIQPEFVPEMSAQKPTENTAQSSPTKFTETMDGLQPVADNPAPPPIPTLEDIAQGWRQTAQAGAGPDRRVLADMAINPAEDTGAKVRQTLPPMPRGERRAIARTPEEIQTQQLFGQARQELGDDASSDQIMARVEELKQPSVTPEPLPLAPKDPFATVATDRQAQAQAYQELGSATHPDFLRRAQEIKTQMLAEQAAPTPTRYEAHLIPNGSGDSAASMEAINRVASEKAAGTKRVVVDTRSGAERPLIGPDAVDYQPKPYESVEFRGGARDGEVVDQGRQARPYNRKSVQTNSTALGKIEAAPPITDDERNVALHSDQLNEIDTFLSNHKAAQALAETRKAIPEQAGLLQERNRVIRRRIRQIKDKVGFEQEEASLRTEHGQGVDRIKRLKDLYTRSQSALGRTPSRQYMVADHMRRAIENNGNITDETRAKILDKFNAKVQSAHDAVREELSSTTDPTRQHQLQSMLERDVILKPGKGIQAKATTVPETGVVRLKSPELTLQGVRELTKAINPRQRVNDLVSLVPEDQRDEVRALKEVDKTAYRQAVTNAAMSHIQGLRDKVAQRLETAKSRVAQTQVENGGTETNIVRQTMRSLKNGKTTLSDLSDAEVEQMLNNTGVIKHELGPSVRMKMKGENGQGTVLEKSNLAEKFIDRLKSEQTERQKATIEGEITPHDAMDFAQGLRDHISTEQPLSEEGHNTLAELGIDSKKPAGEVVAQLDKVMDRARRNEAGFATPGLLFDLRKLPGDAWRKWITDPLLKRIGMGAKYQAVRDASPTLADLFKQRDNAPHAYRQEAAQNTKNIVGEVPHDKERLAALLSDTESRANLQQNHPAEFQQAMADPEVQGVVQRYQKYAQELTAERAGAGFATLPEDYLRRVYDQHMATSTGNQPYEKAVGLQDLPKQSRKASAEYHYENGIHEFGPAYGTKYLAQKLTMLDRTIVGEMAREGTLAPKNKPLPNDITFNGKTYYSPEQAKLIGSKDVYGVYDPLKTTKFKVGDNVILAPKHVVDVASATDRGGAYHPGAIKTAFQKGVIGLGLGIPHAFANVPRRIMTSFEAGMANPRAWAASFKVLFSKDLRIRAEAGVDDPTLRELVRRGAARFDTENTSLGSKWQGLRIGHDLIYKPGTLKGLGGVDVRARMEYADRLITSNPHMGWDKVSEMVEDRFGKYTQENWTRTQQATAHVVAFPGWLYSSIRTGLENPLRATVPAAATIYAINQALYRKGLNRQEDKDDISRIHVGDYALSPTIFSEPFAKAVAGPALAAGQSLIRGGSNREIADQFEQNIPRSAGKSLYAMVPYYAAPLELAFNRQFAGSEKEIFKEGAFDRKGKTGLSEGTEAILTHLGTRIIPQLGRLAPESESGADIPSFLGSQVGLPMFKQDAEARLLRNLGVTGQASHLVDDYRAQRPNDLPQLIKNEPALMVDDAMHAQFEKLQKALKTVDNEMVAFPDKKEQLEAVRTVILSAADEVNDKYQQVRQQQIDTKKDKPVDNLKRVSGL